MHQNDETSHHTVAKTPIYRDPALRPPLLREQVETLLQISGWKRLPDVSTYEIWSEPHTNQKVCLPTTSDLLAPTVAWSIMHAIAEPRHVVERAPSRTLDALVTREDGGSLAFPIFRPIPRYPIFNGSKRTPPSLPQ
jgi:hypothetical protein